MSKSGMEHFVPGHGRTRKPPKGRLVTCPCCLNEYQSEDDPENYRRVVQSDWELSAKAKRAWRHMAASCEESRRALLFLKDCGDAQDWESQEPLHKALALAVTACKAFHGELFAEPETINAELLAACKLMQADWGKRNLTPAIQAIGAAVAKAERGPA